VAPTDPGAGERPESLEVGRPGTMGSMDRQLISSGSPFEEPIGFSRAIRVGHLVAVAGTAPVWPDGSCDPDPYVQSRRCLEIIADALAKAGASVHQVIRTRMYLTDVADQEEVGRAHGEMFGTIRPASTMIVVKTLLDPRWKIEIEADAWVD
jgi:enamine deaminase RidA (YjgF/YER057c/UK114 family)